MASSHPVETQPWTQGYEHLEPGCTAVSLCSWHTLRSTGTTSNTERNKGKANFCQFFSRKKWQPSWGIWPTLLNQISHLCHLVISGCACIVMLGGPWPPRLNLSLSLAKKPTCGVSSEYTVLHVTWMLCQGHMLVNCHQREYGWSL